MATLTVEGKQYDMNKLSDNAKKMASSVAFCDSKIHQLEAELAMVKMARNGFVGQLVSELPKQDVEPAKKTTRKRTATSKTAAKKPATPRKAATSTTDTKKAPVRKRAPAKSKSADAASE